MYTILNIVNALVPFILLPILTNYLSEEEFGIIDIFINMSFIFIPIVGLNVGSTVIRFYYDQEKINFPRFLYNVLLVLVLFGLSLVIVSFFICYFSKEYFSEIKIPYQLVSLAILYALFSQIGEVLLSLWRATEKPLNFGMFRIAKSMSDLGITTFLIVFLKFGWEARIGTSIGVAFIFATLALLIISKKMKVEKAYNRGDIKSALSYSLPLILHSIGGYIISFSDRFIILYYLDVKQVGIYAVAYQIGMIMSFINNSFNQAWTPYLFSQLSKGNKLQLLKLNKINHYYFAFMIALSCGVYLFVPFIYDTFIGHKFVSNPLIVFWILLGYACNGMYKMVVNYMFYYKETKKLGLITLFAAIINVLLSIILVPIYGILGAAVSTTFAFMIMFLIVYVYYRRNYLTKLS